MEATTLYRYEAVIDDICMLDWSSLSQRDLMAAAWAYYYFSVQFRENLEIAVELHPADASLAALKSGECATDNLSPYPGIAAAGERMNHDDFMARLLKTSGLEPARRVQLDRLGRAYLAEIRSITPVARALSISSYEDGGLENVFRAILRARDWHHPSLMAFRHFLVEHIKFDSDDEAGHGALCRHLPPDDRVLPLWEAFKSILQEAVPAFRN